MTECVEAGGNTCETNPVYVLQRYHSVWVCDSWFWVFVMDSWAFLLAIWSYLSYSFLLFSLELSISLCLWVMLSAFLVYGFLCDYVCSFSLCFVISIRSLLCSVKFILVLTCYVPFYCDGPPSHQLCSLVFPISKLNSIIVSHQKADSVLTLYHWSMALINGYWSVPFTELGNDCNHNVVR